MITPNLSASGGSVAATTSTSTKNWNGLKVASFNNETHASRLWTVTFTWHGYSLSAVVAKLKGQRVAEWTFRVWEIEHPSSHGTHELPMFAAFLLECHQRLGRSIRGNRFNQLKLER